MRRSIGIASLALSAWLAAATAWAGDGISSITVRTQGNLTSVAVQAIVRGDDDSSAVLRIFQRRVGAAAYDTGMVMVRRVGFGPTTGDRDADDGRAGNVYEGRILWLEPGDRVQFYVEGRDAGGDWTTQPLSVGPGSIRQLDASGPVFFVSAAAGSDANDGTRTRPTRTIGAALAALSRSRDHGRHGGIFVAPGEYHERIDFDAARFPDDGGPWFIEGDGVSRDSTIVCGANRWAEQGVYAPGKPIRWTFTGQDSTWACLLPAATGPGDSTQLVILGWGELLHRKTSLKAVLDDSTWAYTPASPGGVGSGELSGWWWQNDTLYVKRANGGSPEGLKLHLGYLDRLFAIQRRNVRIANLTFRYAGGLESTQGRYRASVNPSVDGIGIAAGLRGTATGIVIDSCRFYGFNAAAIYIVHGWGGFVADSAVVAHCIIDNLRLGRMSYGASKSRPEESAGQVYFRTRGGTFYGNLVTDTFNGIGMDTSPEDSAIAKDCEISHNEFRNIADDAIEMDDSHCLNTLVAENTIVDCGDGISAAPLWDGGPLFAFYNSITRARVRGIKGGSGTVGIAQFVHNVIRLAAGADVAVDLSPGGTHDGSLFANNLLDVGRFGAIRGPALDGTSSATNRFNFDAFPGSGTKRLATWNGTAYSLSTFRSELGWERNGIASDLPARAGRRWTGVNTGLSGPRFHGAAPWNGTAPD